MDSTVTINGAVLHYRLLGPPDAPLIITLHGGRGFGDKSSDFKAYSPLSDAFRVLSFDFRGHGQSSVTGPFTFRQLVDDIEALRCHFVGKHQKIIVLGGSFGGYLAQQYAIEYPDSVSHLILRGTAPSHNHEIGALKSLESRLSKAPGATREMLVDGVFGAFKDDEEFRKVMLLLAPLYTETYNPEIALVRNRETVFRAKTHNDLYSNSEKYFDYRKKLKDIRAPTLIIVGEKDWICPVDQSILMNDKIPNSELLVVPNANHSVHLEQNGLVLQKIRQFLYEKGNLESSEKRKPLINGHVNGNLNGIVNGKTNGATQEQNIRISIDRGGTFCDVIVQIPGREDEIFKLLSVDPQNYADAPTEAIRRALEIAEDREIPKGEKLDGSRIESCRIGTTVATNALLEKKGEKFALLTTKGMKDVCEIGDQSRPRLFDLNIRKPDVLFSKVVEIEERVTTEDYDLNPFPQTQYDDSDPDLVKTPSGEVIRIIEKLDIQSTEKALHNLREEGYNSIAIALMHSHVFPDHERLIARMAKKLGFEFIALSSDLSSSIKILRRSTSVCSEAYLTPIVRRYVDGFLSGFKTPPKRVDFMCSDGGLKHADKFSGNAALLSGPAGGVVGIARSCYDPVDGTAIIGFDMGGTSTDISRYDGKFEHINSNRIAGRTISTTMLDISTVAAGGGSILTFRNGLFVVGPESASAHPGPACYRKGGPLTITDANLFLGRLVISSFPSIFGKNANEPLDRDIVAYKFEKLTKEINDQSQTQYSPEDVALGFIKIANESMSRPIRNVTEARGFATSAHNLVSFGGAGGQHCCAIATSLGIQRIMIHKYSSLLSAYGISLAELVSEASEPSTSTLSKEILPQIQDRVGRLRTRIEADLLSQGADSKSIIFETFLDLRYKGTDTNISIKEPSDGDYKDAFIKTHLREFAFSLARDVIVDRIVVRGTGKSGDVSAPEAPLAEFRNLRQGTSKPEPDSQQQVYVKDGWKSFPVFQLADIPRGSQIPGPALIIDNTQTIVIESEYTAFITKDHIIIDKQDQDQTTQAISTEKVSPVQLSVFAHRFMNIAEQMGNTLQRTSISTSIKERLDFSCAIFSPDGALVANAPHIPVHLGSMQFAIQYQHRLWLGKLEPGDVLLTNHPEAGGTHLPDLTVITPVFVNNEIIFYVASRGHHTDIGGIGITSMIPDSKELWEEGVSIKSLKIISRGEFLEAEIRTAFASVASYPGCSATRRINDNISDLKAQVSANQRGINLLQQLSAEFSVPVVHMYMRAIQANAEVAIKSYLRSVSQKFHGKPLTAVDYYDDGTPIVLKITIDGDAGTAVFDFTGTGPNTYGNMNCPISITHSAVIYALRCLVDQDIPLNQGCLNPITISIPDGSILNPSPLVAICGSTIASQRITDTIFRAFGACAASQGCANSFGWGLGGKDPRTGEVKPGWNYGEALGGGSGAGPGWHGAHAVNVHATNTRNTDPEVIEKRTPVLVRRYEIRRGSGGRGKWNGGDGTVREIEARVPLKFSILSERRVYNPYGMQGGRPGALGKNYMFKRVGGGGGGGDGEGKFQRVSLGGKAVFNLDVGERAQINTPGGGGWGTCDDDVGEEEAQKQRVEERPEPV